LTGTMSAIAQQHPVHVSELAALKTELRSFLESEGLPLGVFEALHAFGVDSIQDLERQLELPESGVDPIHKDLDMVGDVGLTPIQVEHLKASLQKRFISSEEEEDGVGDDDYDSDGDYDVENPDRVYSAAAAAADDYGSDGGHGVENPDHVSSGATQLGDAAMQAVLDMPSSEVDLVHFMASSPADIPPPIPTSRLQARKVHSHPASLDVAASIDGAPPPTTPTETSRAFEAEI